MIINFIASVVVAIQLLVGSVSSQLLELGIQDNHRLWLQVQEPCFSSVYDADETEFEDSWTEGLAFYMAELSTGTKVQFLATSEDDAWNRIEKKLWEKSQYKTSILKITKNEF